METTGCHRLFWVNVWALLVLRERKIQTSGFIRRRVSEGLSSLTVDTGRGIRVTRQTENEYLYTVPETEVYTDESSTYVGNRLGPGRSLNDYSRPTTAVS